MGYRIWICIFFFTGFIAGISPARAQYREMGEDEGTAGKFFIAPDFGLVLGTVTRIDLSPALGYYLTNRLYAAAGPRYEFLKDSRQYFPFAKYKTHIYGLRAYAGLDIVRDLNNVIPLGLNLGLFGHIEYEGLSLERQYFDYPSYPPEGRFWHSTALVGAGIRQPAGNKAAFNLLFLWDTDTSTRSLYNSPVIRMGFLIFL